jgi:hypothetical protein
MRQLLPYLLLLAACTTSPSSVEPSRSDRAVASARPVALAPASSEPPAPSRRLITDPSAARRLARAIGSDILLYNAEAIQKARAGGAVPDSLRAEIEEGRELYRSRVSPEHEALYQPAIDEIVFEKGTPKTNQ